MFYSDDDRVFFSDFAEEVELVTSTAKTKFNAIFEISYEKIDTFNGIEGGKIQVICKSSNVSGAAAGDVIKYGNTNYYIIGIQPDGTEITNLILSENQ